MSHRLVSTLVLLGPLMACGALDPLPEVTTPAAVSPTPSPAAPTPSATPSPTATPAAAARWYGIDALSLSEEGDGLDLDDDGEPDNSIWAALDLIESTLYAGLETVINNQVAGGSCEETEFGCTLTAQQAEIILNGLSLALDELLTPGSNPCSDAESPGDCPVTMPYALAFSTEGGQEWMALWGGTLGVDVWVPEELFATVQVELATSPAATQVGPVTLELSKTLVGGGYETEVSVTLHDALAEFVYSSETLADGKAAGAIPVVNFVSLAEGILEALTSGIEDLPPGALDPIISSLEEALTGISDVTCDGKACISACVDWSAVRVDVDAP